MRESRITLPLWPTTTLGILCLLEELWLMKELSTLMALVSILLVVIKLFVLIAILRKLRQTFTEQ